MDANSAGPQTTLELQGSGYTVYSCILEKCTPSLTRKNPTPGHSLGYPNQPGLDYRLTRPHHPQLNSKALEDPILVSST